MLVDEAQASALLSRVRATGVRGLARRLRHRVLWTEPPAPRAGGRRQDRSQPSSPTWLTDPDDLALTTAIIAMAHSLGITVVAEGIESGRPVRDPA